MQALLIIVLSMMQTAAFCTVSQFNSLPMPFDDDSDCVQ
jgi:hypothetical protein